MTAINDWKRMSLDAVLSIIESGSRPKGGVSSDHGDIPSLGGENIISTGGINLKDVNLVPLDFYSRMTKGHLNDRDVLINKDGAQTGKVGFYQAPNNTPACINEHLFLLRGNPARIDQKYLYYSLLSQKVQNQIRSQISGSAQPGLKSDFIKGVIADIPDSLHEQSKITDILSTVDQAIEETEGLIAKQERIKTGLMQDLLTKGIDEKGNLRSEETHEFKDSPLGRIPVEWEVKSLEQITTKIVDGVHHTPNYIDYGVPFIVVTDLTAGLGISFENTRYISEVDHKQFLFRADPQSGDVLVTKDGTLGVARVVTEDYPEFSIFVSVAMLRPRKESCLPHLICSFFDSGEFLTQLGALSAGTGLAHIHLEHFRKFQLKQPPLAEQKVIFQILHQQQELRITGAHEELSKLKRIKTALMHDLLTGRKRVTALLDKAEAASA